MTSSMAARQLGFEPFAGNSPVELRTNSEDNVRAVIWAAGRSSATTISWTAND